jgi:hypothetical protein
MGSISRGHMRHLNHISRAGYGDEQILKFWPLEPHLAVKKLLDGYESDTYD